MTKKTSNPKATIAALAECSWIDDRESVVFVGESGTGKTMAATALAVCACRQGRRVRFTTLAGLANELQEAESRRELGRVVVATRGPSSWSWMSLATWPCPRARRS